MTRSRVIMCLCTSEVRAETYMQKQRLPLWVSPGVFVGGICRAAIVHMGVAESILPANGGVGRKMDMD